MTRLEEINNDSCENSGTNKNNCMTRNDNVTGTMDQGRQVLKGTLSIALLVLVALLPVASKADEEIQSESETAAPDATTPTFDSLRTDSKYAPRWRLLQRPLTTAYSENWSNPMSDIHFLDSSTMARVTRMRKLSLLTLARAGQGRLFLGVSEKGVLGVHFSAIALRGNDDYVELARMPYLTPAEEEEAEGNFN